MILFLQRERKKLREGGGREDGIDLALHAM